MGLSIFDERTPIIVLAELDDADGTTPLAITLAQLFVWRADAILCVSTAVASRDVELRMSDNAIDQSMLSATVPPGAGVAGVAPFDLLSVLPTSYPGIIFPPLYSLLAAVSLALLPGEVIDMTIVGGQL